MGPSILHQTRNRSLNGLQLFLRGTALFAQCLSILAGLHNLRLHLLGNRAVIIGLPPEEQTKGANNEKQDDSESMGLRLKFSALGFQFADFR